MRVIASIIAASLLCTGTLYAKKPEHAGKGKKEKSHKKHKKANRHFSSKERHIIQAYYKNLPPGLQKKMRRGGELPPGWEKKVSVGKQIPHEYMTVAKPLPAELSAQIPAGPVGSKLLQIADKIIRVETGTNMVLEALEI